MDFVPYFRGVLWQFFQRADIQNATQYIHNKTRFSLPKLQAQNFALAKHSHFELAVFGRQMRKLQRTNFN